LRHADGIALFPPSLVLDALELPERPLADICGNRKALNQRLRGIGLHARGRIRWGIPTASWIPDCNLCGPRCAIPHLQILIYAANSPRSTSDCLCDSPGLSGPCFSTARKSWTRISPSLNRVASSSASGHGPRSIIRIAHSG
jgi:hypothetical protein